MDAVGRATTRCLAMLLAGACFAGASACGGGARSAGPAPTIPNDAAPAPTSGPDLAQVRSQTPGLTDWATFQLWFVRHIGPGHDGPCCHLFPAWRTPIELGIWRGDIHQQSPELLETMVQALIDGPSPDETRNGFTSAIDPRTRLLGVALENGVAMVDIASQLAGGGERSSFRTPFEFQLAQIVFTLTQFPAVKRVQFALDGQVVPVVGAPDEHSDSGVVLHRPVSRADYAADLPGPWPASVTQTLIP